MKRLTLILLAVTAIFAGQNASAQGKYGADSAECIKYLSYYQEYYKQKNFDSALPNWRKAYSICPATASQNLFVHGSTLINREINKNRKNPAYFKALVDTLLTLQDQRLQYYPRTPKGVDQKATILNNKGQYMINFRSEDAQYLYDNLSAIIDELGSATKGGILVNDLQAAINLYREGKMEADQVIGTYDIVSAAIAGAGARSDAEAEDNAKTKATIESIFADSKVASCENLIAIFTPRFEADPENITVVSNIVKLMNGAEDCAANDLYFKAVTQMYKLDPSYRSAYGLYKLNAARGNVADAARYLEEAIASEESDEATDAQYYYELARFCYANGMRARAFENAGKAVRLDYGYAGKAYMIMGNLWASATCGGDVDKYARYWAATDYFQKAKAADASLADDANSSIANVSRYYPEASEIFMYDLGAGQSYTVSCGGMSTTTSVRVSR
ncbi:MAG: hypothetical protein IJ721_04375 [Bacteroidales bacterium]|nr:hypothetical protein [Bacteroidales bacterium]